MGDNEKPNYEKLSRLRNEIRDYSRVDTTYTVGPAIEASLWVNDNSQIFLMFIIMVA